MPLGLPEIFALGAAIGRLEYLINFLAIKFSGILIATVFSPPVITFGTISFFSKIIVSGPGQNFSISFDSISPTLFTNLSNILISAIWSIKGLSLALPFAAYIFLTAFSSNPFAPNP